MLKYLYINLRGKYKLKQQHNNRRVAKQWLIVAATESLYTYLESQTYSDIFRIIIDIFKIIIDLFRIIIDIFRHIQNHYKHIQTYSESL